MKDQTDVWTRFWFLFKLCEHHKGEVVQITHRANRWHLTPGPCPPPSVPAQFRCHRDWLVASRGAASTGCVSQTDREKYYLELGRTDDMYIRGSAQAQAFLEGKQWYADDDEGRQRYADAHLKTFCMIGTIRSICV